MKKIIFGLLLTLTLNVMYGEDLKPTPATPAKESKEKVELKLSDSLVIAYFKARAENAEAQARVQATVQILQQAVEALQKVCPVTLDPTSGLPSCQVSASTPTVSNAAPAPASK